MYEGKDKYLNTIKKRLEVHGTVYVDEKAKTKRSYMPSFVTNHGLQKPEDFHVLLRKSKIFVGLGFPYEGPAPLEAIANGAVYLNPKFSTPIVVKYTVLQGQTNSKRADQSTSLC